MSGSVRLSAAAKINLDLSVLGRRADGYHSISTVMQSVSLSDTVSLFLSTQPGVSLSVQGATIEGQNLAAQAAELFLARCGVAGGVRIELKKSIPLSAGLAGGSTDAAAVLVGLNHLLGQPFSVKALCALGTALGADVPFCITGGTQLATGIGEVLTPVFGMPEMQVVLLKEHTKATTAEMYRRMDALAVQQPCRSMEIVRLFTQGDFTAAAQLCKNDFFLVSPDAVQQHEMCSFLYQQGAVLASLSGSGPTVFGLFEQLGDEVFSAIKIRYPSAVRCITQTDSIRFTK